MEKDKKKSKSELPIIKKLTKSVELHKLNNGSIVVHSTENKVISIGDSSYVKTGISIFLPTGYIVMLSAVDATYINDGIYIHTAKTIITNSMTDELLVLLQNEGTENFVVSQGSAVAILSIIKTSRKIKVLE